MRTGRSHPGRPMTKHRSGRMEGNAEGRRSLPVTVRSSRGHPSRETPSNAVALGKEGSMGASKH